MNAFTTSRRDACERVCIFELTACKLCSALFDRGIELGSILGCQLVVIREQHLDGDTPEARSRVHPCASTTSTVNWEEKRMALAAVVK